MLRVIDDRPWEMLSKEEQDAICIETTGEPCRPLTDEEKEEIRKEIEEIMKDKTP